MILREKSILSLLVYNLLLLVSVLFYSTNILTVVLIYALETLLIIILQISKVLYLHFSGKQKIFDTFKDPLTGRLSIKSCSYIFILVIIIFVVLEGFSSAWFNLIIFFTTLNYQIELSTVIIFTIIFTLSHLISFVINFTNKLNQENLPSKTSNQQEFHSQAVIINFVKISLRIATLSFICIFGIFYDAMIIWLGLSNYMKYFVVVYCIIKTYFDYETHILEHNFKEKYKLQEAQKL